jgi:hypothetical protein
MFMSQVEIKVPHSHERKSALISTLLEPSIGDVLSGGYEIVSILSVSDTNALGGGGGIYIQDNIPKQILRGDVTIFEVESGKVLHEDHNIVVNSTRPLFARLLTMNTEPLSGVWGLALGAGGTGANGWSANTQPDPTATQLGMVSEIKRKQVSQVNYLDSNDNPTNAITNSVGFLTTLNATTDNITLPIREMGLIGGGTTNVSAGGPTNMLTAPYWDPAVANPNSVTLLTYLTTPPFILPPQISVGIRWQLQL